MTSLFPTAERTKGWLSNKLHAQRADNCPAQHLNLTTKFSTATINLSIAIETLKAFVFDETKNESISVVETPVTMFNVLVLSTF